MNAKQAFTIAHLRVNTMSLAAEGAIIRRQERRARAAQERAKAAGKVDAASIHRLVRLDLAGHRRGSLREEARIGFLAYAYARGVAYRLVERDTHSTPDWSRVAAKVARAGTATSKGEIEAWGKTEASTTATATPKVREPVAA